ncbi:hypothetical protein G6F56_005253 [Rhizopus delemar]|nr:hypothetical protein G6F56_005253 [Rhizopus delemar]
MEFRQNVLRLQNATIWKANELTMSTSTRVKSPLDQREWNDWNVLKEKLVKAHLRSLKKSKPRMSCTFLEKQEMCKECPAMLTSNVMVYYTDLHVTECIQHCKHMSLPEAHLITGDIR